MNEEEISSQIYDSYIVTMFGGFESAILILIGYALFLIGSILLAKNHGTTGSKILLTGTILSFLFESGTFLIVATLDTDALNSEPMLSFSLLNIGSSFALAIIGLGMLKLGLEKRI